MSTCQSGHLQAIQLTICSISHACGAAGAEAAAAAEKLRQEDAILERAEKIHEARNTKQLPVFPEPKRPKVHWDHVLEEMQWMAKEFAK